MVEFGVKRGRLPQQEDGHTLATVVAQCLRKVPMLLLRGLAGLLLWVVALLLGLIALIACLTVILLPLGIPLLGYARKLLVLSIKLVLPRAVSHPTEKVSGRFRKGRRKATSDMKRTRKRGLKSARRARKKWRIW